MGETSIKAIRAHLTLPCTDGVPKDNAIQFDHSSTAGIDPSPPTNETGSRSRRSEWNSAFGTVDMDNTT